MPVLERHLSTSMETGLGTNIQTMFSDFRCNFVAQKISLHAKTEEKPRKYNEVQCMTVIFGKYTADHSVAKAIGVTALCVAIDTGWYRYVHLIVVCSGEVL